MILKISNTNTSLKSHASGHPATSGPANRFDRRVPKGPAVTSALLETFAFTVTSAFKVTDLLGLLGRRDASACRDAAAFWTVFVLCTFLSLRGAVRFREAVAVCTCVLDLALALVGFLAGISNFTFLLGCVSCSVACSRGGVGLFGAGSSSGEPS